MGGKSTTSTQGVSIPPAVLAQYQSVNQKASQTANTPFQQYGGQFVAPVNAEQQSGIAATNATAQEAQPYYQAAAGLTAASANPVNASPLTTSSINQYLSPYLQDVVGSESQLLNQNNQQQQAGQLGTAISSGAFGGDRTGIAAANLEQQQNLSNANIYSGLLNQGYDTALQTAQQQQGVNLSAAQANRSALQSAGSQLAGIGSSAQTSGLQGASAQLGAGTLQQQTQQAQDTALYQQFLQQQSYPFQVDQFLANIAEGTGALSGSTTTTTQPGGFFSDERLKDNIKKIGKSFDGQDIYSYSMRGDPRTRIGFMAHEVQKKHPDAIGLAAGYKTVNYDKATSDSAKKGKFAQGGVAGYAAGGDTDIDSILAAQRQMYGQAPGGAGAFGLQAGSVPRGGSSRVPPPVEGGSPHLMTAQGGLHQQPSGVQDLTALTNLASNAHDLYTKSPDLQKGIGAVGSAVQSGWNDLTGAGTPSPDPSLQNVPQQNLGGRIGRDSGGGVNPYDTDDQLNIPDQQNQRQLATAPGLPQQQSGLGNVTSIIGDASKLMGMFGLKSGGVAGRRHFEVGGTGGDPDDPTNDPTNPPMLDAVTVQSTRPPPVTYTGGVSNQQIPAPNPQMPNSVNIPSDDAAPAAAPAPSAGVAPPANTDHKNWWDRNKGNVLPLLSGLAAMGTAPTKHLGVALAAGLGAAANDYVPTQEGLAQTQGLQIANRLAGMKADAYQDWMSPSNSQSPTIKPPTNDGGPAPNQPYEDYLRQKMYVPPVTAPEAARLEKAQNLSQFLGNGPAEAVKSDIKNRYDGQMSANQNWAKGEADKFYQTYNDPTSTPQQKQAALDNYNKIFQWTGDKVNDVAGSMRIDRNNALAIGNAAQGLTPREQTQASIENTTVEKDANGNLFRVTRIPMNGQTPGVVSAMSPGAAPPATTTSPTPPAPTQPTTTTPKQGRPARGAAPVTTAPASTTQQSALPLLPVNLNSLPSTTGNTGWTNESGKVTQVGDETYRQKLKEDLAEKNDDNAKQRALIDAAQHELKQVSARTVGPGSKAINAFNELRTAVTGHPPDALVDQELLDKYLVTMGAGNVKSLLSNQRITNGEMMQFMSRGVPNVDQTLPTIQHLVDYYDADNRYDTMLNATKIKALEMRKDPISLGTLISTTPGASRSEFIQKKLGFVPGVAVTRPGQQSSGSSGGSYLPEPPVGTVRGNRRYIGGGAGNPANWVKQ